MRSLLPSLFLRRASAAALLQRIPSPLVRRAPLICVCAGAAGLMLSCAGQIYPGGGPVDVEPPRIVRTIPDSNATRVTAGSVELEFSEYVERRSVEESIFISPPVGTIEYDWSGKTVRMSFADSLRANATYVVNIGTDVADVRAGNKMARGYTLAFSTGDSIDRGSIAGRVYDEKPAGVMIFAYMLQGRKADTLNPTHTRPDFIMQTGKDGTFELSHLTFGRYRVLAVRDEYRNLFYDRQVDAYGVWRSDPDVTPDHPAVRDLRFRLTREDTTRPFLTSARALDNRKIAVRFSESVDTLGLEGAGLTVVDTASRQAVPQAIWYLDYSQPADAGILTTVPLDSGRVYSVQASGFRDYAGNRLDSLHAAATFTAEAGADTTRPSMTLSVRDSARDVASDAPITVQFSEPVIPSAASASITLYDSSRTVLPQVFRWRGGVGALVWPRGGFKPAGWYSVRVILDSVRDYRGNSFEDSSLVVRFRTGDFRSTGTIEGGIKAESSWSGPVAVGATVLGTSPPATRSVSLRRPGPYRLENLPEGRYTVEAFAALDSAGSYQYGLPFPFKPSLPFGIFPDTVKVRARWGVQGADILMK